SYPLWQQLYGGNPGANGQQVCPSGRPFTIVGIMPQRFGFVGSEARFWVPPPVAPQRRSDEFRASKDLYKACRLKAGATIAQAQEQVNAINAANQERFPQFKQLLINAGFHTKVELLQEVLVRGVRPTLYLLWGGAAFVLLIGAVNLANVALARSNLRAKELATRPAIGAGRAQVARQLIIESLMLSLAAGAAGIIVGYGILRGLMIIGLERIPRAHEIHMDSTVIVAALAVSMLAGVLIGLVPAVHLFKVNLS